MKGFTHRFVLNKGGASTTNPAGQHLASTCLTATENLQATHKFDSICLAAQAALSQKGERMPVGGSLPPAMDPLGSFG